MERKEEEVLTICSLDHHGTCEITIGENGEARRADKDAAGTLGRQFICFTGTWLEEQL